MRDQAGAAAVEFALIASLLLMLVFGIIVYGQAFSKLEVFHAAAREGARYAAVRCQPDATTCTNALIQARVKSAANPYDGFIVNPVTEVVGDPPIPSAVCDDDHSGMPVTVSWQQSIPINIPLLPPFTYNTTIKGVFRCE